MRSNVASHMVSLLQRRGHDCAHVVIELLRITSNPNHFKREDQVCHLNARYSEKLIYSKTNILISKKQMTIPI